MSNMDSAGDIIICPAAATEDLRAGSFVVNSGSGEELLAIHSNKTISILGETFSLEKIVEALKSYSTDACVCQMNVLMTKGCICGGS